MNQLQMLEIIFFTFVTTSNVLFNCWKLLLSSIEEWWKKINFIKRIVFSWEPLMCLFTFQLHDKAWSWIRRYPCFFFSSVHLRLLFSVWIFDFNFWNDIWTNKNCSINCYGRVNWFVLPFPIEYVLGKKWRTYPKHILIKLTPGD